MDGIVGMIKLSLQPQGNSTWRLCDGSLLETAAYPELHALMGNRFGGGDTTFALPDLRGDQAHYLMKVVPGPEDAEYQGLVSQMVLWVGDDLPAGWLPCDGRLVVGTEYPLLQKVAAANQPEVPDTFNLPLVEAKSGIRYIICVNGLDPTPSMGNPVGQDDDDY